MAMVVSVGPYRFTTRRSVLAAHTALISAVDGGFAAQGHHSQRGVSQPGQTAALPEQPEVAGERSGSP